MKMTWCGISGGMTFLSKYFQRVMRSLNMLFRCAWHLSKGCRGIVCFIRLKKYNNFHKQNICAEFHGCTTTHTHTQSIPTSGMTYTTMTFTADIVVTLDNTYGTATTTWGRDGTTSREKTHSKTSHNNKKYMSRKLNEKENTPENFTPPEKNKIENLSKKVTEVTNRLRKTKKSKTYTMVKRNRKWN